jgi:hypothetical protein
MYSFAQRPDTIVFDEPLYAHYLRVTGAVHPGRGAVLRSLENDGNTVIEQIIHGRFTKPIAFFKQMTHHLADLHLDFLQEVSNIIFIRDPKQIIRSYAQVIQDLKMQDIGIDKQWELCQFFIQKKQPFVVIDSGEILKNPKKVLSALCIDLEIPFYTDMLSWPAGPKPYDGVWAKYWYGNVHKSTHFTIQESSSRELPDYLQPLYLESKKYYDQLYQHSTKA